MVVGGEIGKEEEEPQYDVIEDFTGCRGMQTLLYGGMGLVRTVSLQHSFLHRVTGVFEGGHIVGHVWGVGKLWWGLYMKSFIDIWPRFPWGKSWPW